MEAEVELRAGPMYIRVQESLKEQICSGIYSFGEFLPAESQLAADYKVSVGTMKKALQLLQEDGYIERRRRRGTRVVFEQPKTAMKEVLVCIGDIRQSFFAEIYRGIQRELNTAGARPMLVDSECDPEHEQLLLEKFITAADAVIVAPYAREADFAIYEQLLAQSIPVAFVDRFIPELRIDAVVSDNVEGGRVATQHLIDLGHRRIAIVDIGPAVSMSQRFDGYRQALADSGLPFDPDLVYHAKSPGYDSAYATVAEIREKHPDVTAAFCCRDDSAWGCIQQLLERGLVLPEQFSVVGYDDNADICSRIRPALTTVRQQKEEVGETVARLLLQQMNGGRKGTRTVVSIPVELIVRHSTAAPLDEQ